MTPAQYAANILGQYWDYSLPINPVRIAEQLNISVYYDNTLHLSAQYNEEKNEINVNNSEPVTRQRFSIAHEIGHAIMGHGSSPREQVPYSLGNYQQKEFEANEFAAELLMPKEVVGTLALHTKKTFEELCILFAVSPKAMKIRLVRLGYL